MFHFKVKTMMAYFATIYILTALIYLVITHSYGTPFKDAVQRYPELVRIKAASVNERRHAFYIGLAISTLAMIIIRPFS